MGGGDFTAKQDGNILTVERTFTNRDGQTMSYPKIINIQSTMTTPNGERKLTMVYDKK